jgi:hypothetical protein
MADEKKEPEKKTDEKAYSVATDIIQMTASTGRKINLGNYESREVFISGQVMVPRGVPADMVMESLIDWVNRHADREERAIRRIK